MPNGTDLERIFDLQQDIKKLEAELAETKRERDDLRADYDATVRDMDLYIERIVTGEARIERLTAAKQPSRLARMER
jgi:uncharacterized small protein (DUF1192 family)